MTDGLCLPNKRHSGMEQWKDIPGYEGLYQASDLGKIRTAAGKVTQNAKYSHRVWKQRIMRPKLQTKRGRTDERVELWKEGRHSTHLVARLVARTWVEGYSEGLTVNHIDGNPMNNASSNLEWTSLGDNIRKGFEIGLYSTQKPVTLVNMSTKEAYAFRSLSCASRFLGRNNGYISNVIHKGQNTTSDGYRIII